MKPLEKVDAELMKQVPLMTAHKKEVATFTMRGAIVTAFGFMAFYQSGWYSWVLWVVFAVTLFILGADFNKVLQRQDEPPLTILKP